MTLKDKLRVIWRILVGDFAEFHNMEIKTSKNWPAVCVMFNCKIVRGEADE